MSVNRVRQLLGEGQSVWLDYVSRALLTQGTLLNLIAADGVKGVTSNPAIFEKSIGTGTDYDPLVSSMLDRGDASVNAVYEHLAITDIRDAADQLLPVYQATNRRDGYISLEVSPYLAHDAQATEQEGLRLWRAVSRSNLMIKVPATEAGSTAIRGLIAAGVNVNVTLLFAQSAYEAVAEAYVSGLEAFAAGGGDLSHVASVASFFISRVDVMVDAEIERRLATAEGDGEALGALRGRVAIANAKLAYRYYQTLVASPRWQALAAKGAMPQRLLWASTGTKNPNYRDVLYVEELIGPETVNTMPPATLDAFRDHGSVRASLTERVDEAAAVLAEADQLGIDRQSIADRLLAEGLTLFVDAADALLATVAAKRLACIGNRIGRQDMALGDLESAMAQELDQWRRSGGVRRLWARDPALWTGGPEADWLGWLDVVVRQIDGLDRLSTFRDQIAALGLSHVVLLGMGGSSLGPEVIGGVFGSSQGFPQLLMLDSTDPAQIAALTRRIDLARSLFIVSSKSGSTLETAIFFQHFHALVRQAIGNEAAGKHFVAVTDPGSELQKLAEREGFLACFLGDKQIGGRYSVLSDFGLVPAAAIGVDVKALLASAQMMVNACGGDVPASANPGVRFGLALGLAHRQGRDKVTIVTSVSLAGFGAWAEQLIAESTGKKGLGLIPIDREPLGAPSLYGEDRFFVSLSLDGDDTAIQDQALDALAEAGHPVVRIRIADPIQLGQEFFRWEIATAVAGAVIGIDPFDQPDVEASKIKTRELTARFERDGVLPSEEPLLVEAGISLFADPRNEAELAAIAGEKTLSAYLGAHLARLQPGDYAALLAYLDQNADTVAALRAMRTKLLTRFRVATSVGFGPRFLHSTGQGYKGGPASGVFLQLTCDHAETLPVPGSCLSFNIVEAAQAQGDLQVLVERGRRVLRLHLGRDVAGALAHLLDLM